jgi:hypothetical protein
MKSNDIQSDKTHKINEYFRQNLEKLMKKEKTEKDEEAKNKWPMDGNNVFQTHKRT